MPLTTDSLVSTKLRPSQARPNLVARPRLIERLKSEPGRRLTLITAPAGFGKTTLLGEWVADRSDERSIAWVSLDEGDNDPARFLSYLVASLRTIDEEIGEGVLSSLRAPGSAQAEALAAALLNELADLPGTLVIVLDDYHLIHSDQVHGVVSFMLERLPSNVHLLISSRIEPPLQIARLRARGQITEINASDLSFAREEAATFLKDTMGLELSEEDVDALEERTEGWIAGLQLAALSMRNRKDVSGFIQAFSGSHRDVLDFLTEEVLERQSERIRSFLVETSILERLSGELCDAVTDRDDGQEMLETLERENLFVVALDDERRWYRYHHLFANFLQGHLKRERPERVKDLHLRAASWDDLNSAEDRLTKSMRLAEPTSKLHTLVDGYIALSRVQRARGDVEVALETAQEADRLAQRSGIGEEVVKATIWKARLHLTMGDLATAAFEQERASGVHSEGAPIARETERIGLARLLVARGEYGEVLRFLPQLREAAEAAGRVGGAMEILTLEAMTLRASDDKERAVSTLAQALALAEPEGFVRTFADEGSPIRIPEVDRTPTLGFHALLTEDGDPRVQLLRT